jgi:hypothetical protein
VEPKLRVRSSGHGGSGYRHPLDGSVVPGVTTVLRKLDKPAIAQWAVDNTAAFAVANIDALLNRGEEQGYGFLRWYWKRDALSGDLSDIRNYSNGVLNDAANLGTLIHDWIAAEHGACPYPDVRDAPAYFWQMVSQWDEYRVAHEIVPLHTEVTLWSKEHGYAGTADGVWLVDGVPMLIDVKSSRNTWDEHYMQVAALGACDTMLLEVTEGEWVELPMPEVKAYGLLHIRPQDTDTQGNYKEPFCVMKFIDPDEIPLHLESFLGLLKVSHAQNKVKDIRKKASKAIGFDDIVGNKDEEK